MRVFSDSDAGRRISSPQSESIHAFLIKKVPLDVKFLLYGGLPNGPQPILDESFGELLVAAHTTLWAML